MSDIYIGPKKVKNNETLDEKLATGEDLFLIEYEDGVKETFTRRMFEQLIKSAPTDLTQLREDRVFPVVARVLEVLLNWGIKVDEVDYLMQVLTRSVNSNLQESDAKIWGKPRNEINFIDLDKLLREPKMKLTDILPSSSGDLSS